MKHLMISILLLVTSIFVAQNTFARETSKVEKAVDEMVSKYEGASGVTCLTVVKGRGLEIMKAMLNKEFGKSFMKGVTRITLIEYTDASQENCKSLHKDLEVFQTLMDDFDFNNEEEFAENEYVRCFASEEDQALSDFIIAIEDKESKVFMYMAGKITFE